MEYYIAAQSNSIDLYSIYTKIYRTIIKVKRQDIESGVYNK